MVIQPGVEAFNDGSIRFMPPNTKEGANYLEDPDESVPAGARCVNCAHYIEGGGCHVVQGRISPSAVCLRFYADIGVFADDKLRRDDPVSMTLAPNDVETWSDRDARRFLRHVERELKRLGTAF